MHSHFSSTHIEFLRRQAKKLSKATAIPLSKAQDQIAQENGWENWSLMVKNRLLDAPLDLGYQLQRTRAEFVTATNKFRVKQPRWGYLNPFDEVVKQTEDISSKFVSAKNAINFAVSYMEKLLSVPRFKIQRPSLVDIEMHHWLPYCLVSKGNVGQILLNRQYKPVGMMSDAWVEYDEFPNLKTSLTDEQLWAMSHPNAETPGFFYYDGDRPWNDRTKAEAYLGRLRIAQSIL